MKEINIQSNRFLLLVVAFAVIILIGLITLSRPDFVYGATIQETLDEVLSYQDEITPDEAMEIVDNKTPGYKFVDIRNPYEYVKGNIDGSINIPFQKFLADKNIEFFDQMMKDSITVVVYGWDQSEANGPWMFLKQMGYANVKIMMGGYGYYSGETYDMFWESEIPQYFAEEPKYNFIEVMKSMSGGSLPQETTDYETVVPVRKTKKTALEGGC